MRKTSPLQCVLFFHPLDGSEHSLPPLTRLRDLRICRGFGPLHGLMSLNFETPPLPPSVEIGIRSEAHTSCLALVPSIFRKCARRHFFLYNGFSRCIGRPRCLRARHFSLPLVDFSLGIPGYAVLVYSSGHFKTFCHDLPKHTRLL